MARLIWDDVGQRFYETGVDRGVLYLPDTGEFTNGVAWNGLISVSANPSGAEANPQYADNIKYLNLVSMEEFGATVEAFTYPDEFAKCDGSERLIDAQGVVLSQQSRSPFGLSYRTLIGDDTVGTDAGYKIHLIYNALASPSEKSYNTVNESPEAMTFSWELTTTPVQPLEGDTWKPVAHIEIDSRKVTPSELATFEAVLYGSEGTPARLPKPGEVLSMFT